MAELLATLLSLCGHVGGGFPMCMTPCGYMWLLVRRKVDMLGPVVRCLVEVGLRED